MQIPNTMTYEERGRRIKELEEEVQQLRAAAQKMLDLEARRMYEHDLFDDYKGPVPCPCPGCEALRRALNKWRS